MPLEPELIHNREEFDRWRRRKRQALIAVVLTAVPLGYFVPVDIVWPIVVLFLVMAGGVFLFIEYQQVRVFWRDLRERRHSAEK